MLQKQQNNLQQKDYMSKEEIEAIQEKKLLETVNWAYQRSPFYQNQFQKHGVEPEHIRDLSYLSRLPFTVKSDLREAYPFQLAAVPMEEVLRLHASSGTTGKPIVAGYTRKDLEVWSEMVARVCSMAGATPQDMAQVSFGYGLFTGGFGLHYGLEHLGVTVVPFSSGNTERQLDLMQDFGTTVLVSTPSFALYMAEVAWERGMNPRDTQLRLGLFGGEPCSEAMREEIQNQWGILATVNYGLTEVMGPGISGECEQQQGMHILEEAFIPEIIDPETGENLPEGETGELVLTPLIKEGFPIIRYRTGDITRLLPDPCPCGRTTRRMDYITGRTDDMVIVKGVNVFPSQIEEVLAEVKEVSPHYQLVLHRSSRGFVKELEVQVELTPEGFSDSFPQLEKLEENIKNRLRSTLYLAPRIKLMEPKSLERTTGKARRIVEGEER